MIPPRLQVLIATYGRRIEKIDVDGLPRVYGVEYIIACQNPEGLNLDISRFSLRDDIRVFFFQDTGVSRNRNHALDLATAQYILISDDDITYDAVAMEELVATFDSHPGIDIVTTHAVIDGEEHVYPPDSHDLGHPWRFYSPIAFEIALRRSAVESCGLRFAETISIGTGYITCGEENFFYRRCLNAGLSGVFRDIPVSTHSGPTTSSHSCCEPGVVRARGAFMPFDRGYTAALVRLPIEAWRSPLPFFKALAYLAQGYMYYIRHRSEL